MTSDINPAKPGTGRAFTLDVRQNFAAARREIELLQNRMQAQQDALDALAARVAALEAECR